jgi:virulence-associated protein VagC
MVPTMGRTRVFKNSDSLAVRIPRKYAIPVGEVMIDQSDGMLVLMPLDEMGWPDDLETRFQSLADLEISARPKDAKPVKS